MSIKACPVCSTPIILNLDDGVVHYECHHLEHESCYFDIHSQNVTCLICGWVSDQVIFK